MIIVEIQHWAQRGGFQLNIIQDAQWYFCSLADVGLDALLISDGYVRKSG